MKTFSVKPGTTILLDGQKWRIHSAHRKDDGVAVITLKKPESEEFLSLREEEFLQAFADGRVVGVIDDINRHAVVAGKVLDPTYTKKQRKIINYRKKYVFAIMENDRIIPSLKERKKRIKREHEKFLKALAQLDPEDEKYDKKYEKYWDERTVRNWYIDWNKAGRQDYALLPNYGLRQLRQPRKDPKLLEKVKKVIKEVHLQKERWTLKDVAAELPEVSYSTVLRSAKKYFTQHEVDLAQIGYFREKNKTPGNGARPLPDSILVEVESDHHALDVLVVDLESGVILGVAIITLIIDVKSGVIFGRYISFRKNLNAVLKAIRHAILPKSDKRWVSGRPLNFHCDNSDGYPVKTLSPPLFELGIEPTNMRKKHGNDKPKAERGGKGLNEFVCHKLKGTTFSNYVNAEDYKSKKFAFIEMAELIELVDDYILEIHNNRAHKIYKQTRISIWNKDPLSNLITLPMSVHEAHILTMQKSINTINRDGIYINNVLYDDNNLTKLKHRFGIKSEVEVRYDEDALSHIWVRHKEDEYWVKIMSLDPIFHDPNYSLVLHNIIRAAAAKENMSEKEFMEKRRILNNKIRDLNELSGKRVAARASGLSSEHPRGKTAENAPNVELTTDIFNHYKESKK